MYCSIDTINNASYVDQGDSKVSQGQRSENNLMECNADQATQSKRRRQTRRRSQTKRRSQSAAGKPGDAGRLGDAD